MHHIFLLIFLLPVISSCGIYNESKKEGLKETNRDRVTQRIEGLVIQKSEGNKNNAILAIKAFDYIPSVYENCMHKSYVEYHNQKVDHDVVIKDCLFKSRLEMVARYSILNTAYAREKLQTPSFSNNNQLSLLNNSRGFFVSSRTTLEAIIGKISKFAKYDFSVVGASTKNYQTYWFETHENETPLQFLKRIDMRFNNISVFIDTDNKKMVLSYLYSSIKI